MALPTKIKTAIGADLKEMLQWVVLLNFFHDNQDNLSPSKKISIYEKCEEFRNFWNTDRSEPYNHIRNSGERVTLIKYVNSLNIDKSDIKPDNIYTDSDILDYLDKPSDNTTLEQK